jgi:signal transduction histidine kinase
MIKHVKPRYLVFVALGAFALAAFSLLDINLRGPKPFGGVVAIVSGLVGAGCLVAYYYARLRTRLRQVDDLRTSLLAQAHDAAAQQERNRLARELHDSIKQQIFSIGMSAAAVETRWNADPAGAREALHDVQRSAQEAMAEMNALLQQLSPAPLERVGLVQALRDQCEALGYRTDAEVKATFGALPDDDRLPAGAQDSLFRIAQEAFSNIARHARAGHVRVYLGQREANGPLAIEIEDDGQGFEPDANAEGMGLENIRERVYALDGELTIESTPGKGTVLCVTVPLTEPAPTELEIPHNHTLNKVFLVGLCGGLALIAALFYPLYVLLPGGQVEGWRPGSGAVGLALEILAVVLAVATGWVGAWWARGETRQVGSLFGALAGGVAGATLFLGLGAAAAGVVGSGSLLQRGLVAAASDADLARLLSTPAIEIVWWSYGMFWGMLLAGAGLGAAGGALALPAAQPGVPTGLRQAWIVILTAMGFTSTLAFGFAVFVLSQLEGSVREVIVELGVPPATSLPLAGTSLWLVGTPAVFYLVSLTALYVLLRIESKQEHPVRSRAASRTAGVFGLAAIGLPFGILVVNPESIRTLPTLAVVGITTAVSLALGSLYLTTFLQVSRQRPPWRLDRRRIAHALAGGSIVVSLVLMSQALRLTRFWGLLIGLLVTVISIVLIVLLWRQPRQHSLDESTVAWLKMERSRLWEAGIGVVIAVVVPPLVTLSAAISAIVLPINLLPMLASYAEAQGFVLHYTLAEVVRDAYLAHARISFFSLVIVVAMTSLTILALNGAAALVKRLASPRG